LLRGACRFWHFTARARSRCQRRKRSSAPIAKKRGRAPIKDEEFSGRCFDFSGVACDTTRQACMRTIAGFFQGLYAAEDLADRNLGCKKCSACSRTDPGKVVFLEGNKARVRHDHVKHAGFCGIVAKVSASATFTAMTSGERVRCCFPPPHTTPKRERQPRDSTRTTPRGFFMRRENKPNARSGLWGAMHAGVDQNRHESIRGLPHGSKPHCPAGRDRPPAPQKDVAVTCKKQVFAVRRLSEHCAALATRSRSKTWTLTSPRSVRACRAPGAVENRPKKTTLGATLATSRGREPKMRIDDLGAARH
jgi:hypothetical protein